VHNLGQCAHGGIGRRGGIGVTHVDWIDIAIMVRVHVAIRKQAVGEQREENKFGESQELVARQGEACSSASVVSTSWGRLDAAGLTSALA
jgi:hypothetical protein